MWVDMLRPASVPGSGHGSRVKGSEPMGGSSGLEIWRENSLERPSFPFKQGNDPLCLLLAQKMPTHRTIVP